MVLLPVEAAAEEAALCAAAWRSTSEVVAQLLRQLLLNAAKRLSEQMGAAQVEAEVSTLQGGIACAAAIAILRET